MTERKILHYGKRFKIVEINGINQSTCKSRPREQIPSVTALSQYFATEEESSEDLVQVIVPEEVEVT